jgi:hypothetical protein
LEENPQINAFLGETGARLWLQFKIFDVMDILSNIKSRNENKTKRKKIA